VGGIGGGEKGEKKNGEKGKRKKNKSKFLLPIRNPEKGGKGGKKEREKKKERLDEPSLSRLVWKKWEKKKGGREKSRLRPKRPPSAPGRKKKGEGPSRRTSFVPSEERKEREERWPHTSVFPCDLKILTEGGKKKEGEKREGHYRRVFSPVLMRCGVGRKEKKRGDRIIQKIHPLPR